MSDDLKPISSALDAVIACQNASLKRRHSTSFTGNNEPSLDDLMEDDVMQTLMKRDGVNPHQVLTLMDVMRDRLR